MTRYDDPLLIAELRRDEGVEYNPYRCTAGKLTVGVGHNLEAHPLPGMVYPLTDAEVDNILAHDLIDVFADLDLRLPWWSDLTQARQRALINFVFNLGITKALGFKKTIQFLRREQYALAADEILNSKWAEQVGRRAVRVSNLIRNG